jgi:hypothetical protein
MPLAASKRHTRSSRVKLKVSLSSVDLLLYRIIYQATVVAEPVSLEPLVLRAAASAALELGLVLGVSLPGHLDTRVGVLSGLPVNLVN